MTKITELFIKLLENRKKTTREKQREIYEAGEELRAAKGQKGKLDE